MISINPLLTYISPCKLKTVFQVEKRAACKISLSIAIQAFNRHVTPMQAASESTWRYIKNFFENLLESIGGIIDTFDRYVRYQHIGGFKQVNRPFHP